MTPLSNLWSDLRYSARSLWSRPTFAIVVALTLAFGIGVNVAIFSLFQQILLNPLPVAEPQRLVNLSDPEPKLNNLTYGSAAGRSESVFSYPMFRDLEREQEPFVGIAAHRMFDASLSTGERARRDTGMFVSGSYFSVLGLQPALGRLLGPQDDPVDGQAESVVLSHSHWQSEFGGDPEVLGRTLIVNGAPLAIVGVAPRAFHGTTVGTRANVFVPITFRPIDTPVALPNHDNRSYYWLHLFARLKPGIGRDEAGAAINTVFRRILNEVEAPLLAGADLTPQERARLDAFSARSLVLEPGAHGQSSLRAPARGRLALLFAVTGVVLLLCCANVAGLVLVRGSARSGEMAVRASMGATRGRLASLLLAESLLLAVPAAIASVPIALLTLRVVASGVPGIPVAAFDADVDWAAALVAIAVAVVSALAFGLFPVRGLLSAAPATTLQAYGARQTSGQRVTRFRTALATAQIALSMALLALMGLFAQALANIARIDLGFEVDTVVTFSISPETSGYAPEASARLFARLEEEVAALPGVASAASAAVPLLAGGALMAGAGVVGAGGPDRVAVNLNYIGLDFFRTLDVRMLAGRDFDDADRLGGAPVAIVTRNFAERFGLGADIVGRRITSPGGEITVVGLASDAKYVGVTRDVESQVFLPRAQSSSFGTGSATFYVRGLRSPADLMNAVRETAARVDPIVPITGLRTMQDQVRENVATERFFAGASTALAVLTTALAALGLYGVLAYTVAQRSREIGLRFALGAPASGVRGMVLRQVAAMALVGIVLGVAAALLLGRAASSLLFGVAAGDPIALAAAAAVVVAVTLGAAYFPARRASRVDPIVVLRYE